MKKFLSLILAVLMAFAMASVGFAAEPEAIIKLVGPLKYDADKNAMVCTVDIPALGLTRDDNEINEYGDPVYFLALSDHSYDGTPNLAPVSEHKYVEHLKYKVSLENGMEILRGIGITKKYVDVDAVWGEDSDEKYSLYRLFPKSGYYYFAEVRTGDIAATYETDVVGTVKFNRKADRKNGINKIVEEHNTLDFAFSVFYKNNWNNIDECLIIGDREHLEWNTNYALKFDKSNDDEIELSFGTEDNEGTFTVDASGQGKVILRYNTDANEAVANLNPTAKMAFISFNNVKFNRTGRFVYELENGRFCYEIKDGKLLTPPNAECDEADGTLSFSTNTLGSYVFSDVELVSPSAAAK